MTHRLPSLPSPTESQLQSRLVAAERAQHAAEDRARAAKRDAAAAAKAHDAERRRWQTHFDRVQRETELVKVKVDAVKAEHASNLRELVRRNEDLAAVGEALEREREARARCEERLRKAQKIERDALEKLAASEDSLELALATNAERAAKAARRARKSAMDAASGAGGWDEAYADVKEELDALRETLRRREADTAQLSRRADAAEARAFGAVLHTGGHSPELADGQDLIVASPGVPLSDPLFVRARALAIPVWAEVELASRYCVGRIVAVTGSNGKSNRVARPAPRSIRGGCGPGTQKPSMARS